MLYRFRLFTFMAVALCTLAACTEKNSAGEVAARPDPAIIGGKYVKADDAVASSTVALRFRADPHEGEDKVLKSFCSGTLIARNIVLTAAHCVQKINEDIPIEAVFSVDATSKSGAAIAVDAILVHPQFIPPHDACISSYCPMNRAQRAARMGANDLALLLLRSDAPENYQVATLNTDENLPLSLDIITTGYGRRVEGKADIAGILKKFTGKGEYIKNAKKILSMSSKEDSACYGDSGGPIYYMKDQKLVQLGVSSHRSGIASGNACLSTEATAYTSTASYMDWIEQSKTALPSQEEFIKAPWRAASNGVGLTRVTSPFDIWAWSQIKSARLTCVNSNEAFSIEVKMSFEPFFQEGERTLYGTADVVLKDNAEEKVLSFKEYSPDTDLQFSLWLNKDWLDQNWKKTLNDQETLKTTFDSSSLSLLAKSPGINLKISADPFKEDGSGIFDIADSSTSDVRLKAANMKIVLEQKTNKTISADCDMTVSLGK